MNGLFRLFPGLLRQAEKTYRECWDIMTEAGIDNPGRYLVRPGVPNVPDYIAAIREGKD